MEFTFSVRCDVTAEHTRSDASAPTRHVKTDLNLDVSKNLDRDMYFTKDGVPNKDGVKAMTQTLIQGLTTPSRRATGTMWSTLSIVAELTKGFASVANASPSTFDNP